MPIPQTKCSPSSSDNNGGKHSHHHHHDDVKQSSNLNGHHNHQMANQHDSPHDAAHRHHQHHHGHDAPEGLHLHHGDTMRRYLKVLPLVVRDPDEERASSTLEMFYDLVFAVAVAQAGDAFREVIISDTKSITDVIAMIPPFMFIFFAVYWAWTNFTLFATAYDNNDLVFRMAVFFQMLGSLVIASNAKSVLEEGKYQFVMIVVGYTILRATSIPLMWLRAQSRKDRFAKLCRRLALAELISQVGWILFGVISVVSNNPPWLAWLGMAGVFPEVGLIIWARHSAGHLPYNHRHIRDRCSAFYMIVVGEAMLSAIGVLNEIIQNMNRLGFMLAVLAAAFLFILLLWFVYFGWPMPHLLPNYPTRMLAYVCSHYFLIVSVAGVTSGLVACIQIISGHLDGDPQNTGDGISPSTRRIVSFLMSIMTSLFIATITLLRFVWELCHSPNGCTATRRERRGYEQVFPLTLAVLTAFTPLLAEAMKSPEGSGADAGDMAGITVMLCTLMLLLWVVGRLIFEYFYVPLSAEEYIDAHKTCDSKYMPSAVFVGGVVGGGAHSPEVVEEGGANTHSVDGGSHLNSIVSGTMESPPAALADDAPDERTSLLPKTT